MSNIIINVDAFMCEDPIIKSVSYTGTRYIFSVTWTSNGEYYSTFEPTTNLELSVDMYDTQTSTLVQSYVINPSAPFDATDYQFNMFDYYNDFSSKFQIYVKLKITNSVCNNTTTYIVPIDYP